MKTIKITSIALSMLLLFGSAKADKPKNRITASMRFSITSFIDADARGNCDGMAELIADNAKFTMMRGDKLLSFNKKEIVNSMENLRGIHQNCTTNYAVVEASGNYALIKVEMKYPTFSRFNYVTMNQCSDGWKITNVSSIFVK